MHLAVYTESGFFGGGEQFLATLLGALDDRIEVTVVGTTTAVVDQIASSRSASRTRTLRPPRNRRDIGALAAHHRLLRELRPDVLQTNGTPWTCHYALMAGVATPRMRTLAVYHIVRPAETRWRLWRSRVILRHVDAQVSVFGAGARALERWVWLREGTVRAIHNGVPDPPITPVTPPVSGPIIGTVGRLAPQKGQDVLLRALPALPGVTAVLIGDGADRTRLERLARELGVEDRVLMPGWMAEPRAWLPTFDIFVLPSRVEGLPLVILEAMLASRPVVATRVDGIPEEVLHGRTGLLVPPDDPDALAEAVRTLLRDPARRDRMGEEGRTTATEQFSLEKMVKSYESLYAELTNSGEPHVPA
jgi:glycosyltransferase involved in cell wall biosynthesis